MAMFDPQKAREENKNRGIPAGDYLLAIKKFDRRTSKKNKDYLHCQVIVIAGAGKGRSFFDNISLDTTNSGAMFRLGVLAEQCGVERSFDLDSDDDIKANLCGRPFKARVSLKHENGYANNGIERYITGDKVTDRDRELMEQWLVDSAAESDWNGGSESSDGGEDVPPPTDDDIPFLSAHFGHEPCAISRILRGRV